MDLDTETENSDALDLPIQIGETFALPFPRFFYFILRNYIYIF